ncbi:helix-turn-helix domain-containing protein [Pseudozobellia thermophila]|uniref:AraC-type DNA-binding protein n=1 Tax=Pseudozobellia thermophila TaxID=192903 RepID=A0A1M6I978_9FLAO|nr:helix-turn-helix transcriptional regulator [Pseudozobellia thermophila]SHJ30997.1 AraC-type DNA-binding protein [Pseudozobellia thermophila]
MKTGPTSTIEHTVNGVAKTSAIGYRYETETGAVEGEHYEVRLEGATVYVRRLLPEHNARMALVTPDACYGVHFVLEGSCTYVREGGGYPVVLQEGAYNLLQWPAKKKIQTFGEDRVVLVEVLFTRLFVEDLLGKSQESVYGQFFEFPGKRADVLWKTSRSISREMKKELFAILDCPHRDRAKCNYLASKTKLLLIDLFLGRGKAGADEMKEQLSPSDREAMERVVKHIKKHLKKKLTIKELSEIAGFNTTKLKSTFKKVHRTTVFKYITRTRMEKASSLILEKDYSIAQASYEVGYSNPQHFTVAFKKTMGYLPSALLSSQ